MAEDYALLLNRDAQVNVLETALPLLKDDARVVFVTSHQAHFIPHHPDHARVRAGRPLQARGEDALREKIPALEERGIGFTVVSGDMIEAPSRRPFSNARTRGPSPPRRDDAGKLYNVSEFAAEVARAAVDPVPADNTRLVGDTGSFEASDHAAGPTSRH